MHPSVAKAWPAFVTAYEGRCSWLYLDTLKLPTTGLGYRVVDRASMLALPWLTAAGTPATGESKILEWNFINGRTDLAPKGGFAFKAVASLHLPDDEINRLLSVTTDRFWQTLSATLPNLEAWPADAQLALLDMAYNLGPNFLGPKWPNFTAAAKAADFTACAETCLRAVKAPRDYRHRILFTNAAKAVAWKLDPGKLWDAVVPVQPPPPPPPKEPDVQHSNTYHSDFVNFRGGLVPPVVRDVLLAIPSPANMVQGGLQQSAVAASAATHNGLGAYDLGVKGWSRAKILTLCAELIRSGEVAFPRGGWFGSAMFSTHVHVCSNNAYASLHPEAKAQVADFKRGKDGLARHGKYVGPSTPLGSWSTSPYNPKNIRPGGTYEVVSGSLQGLNVDRKAKAGALRKKGYRVVAARQVHRWGRWNAVTEPANTYYAIADDAQTYLKPV